MRMLRIYRSDVLRWPKSDHSGDEGADCHAEVELILQSIQCYPTTIPSANRCCMFQLETTLPVQFSFTAMFIYSRKKAKTVTHLSNISSPQIYFHGTDRMCMHREHEPGSRSVCGSIKLRNLGKADLKVVPLPQNTLPLGSPKSCGDNVI